MPVRNNIPWPLVASLLILAGLVVALAIASAGRAVPPPATAPQPPVAPYPIPAPKSTMPPSRVIEVEVAAEVREPVGPPSTGSTPLVAKPVEKPPEAATCPSSCQPCRRWGFFRRGR